MKRWVITDLDDTLYDASHRDHLAKEKRWDEFHSLCHLDPVNRDVADLLKTLRMAHVSVIALTARPSAFRQITREKISKDLPGVIDCIIMRPEGNRQSSDDFKERAIREFFGTIEVAQAEIAFVLDDRDKVIRRMRSLGIPAWQVREGKY